jgi:hypothetical protein
MQWKVATSTDVMRYAAIGKRQWALVDPHVEPLEISPNGEGEVAIKGHQVVRDLEGNLLADRLVTRLFQVRNGSILRVDICDL